MSDPRRPLAAAPRPVLGLKIDVDTFDGLNEGVPRLLALLARLGVRATFYVPGGPDHSGRAVLRLFRQRGFAAKMRRTGGFRLYGVKTALRGTLLPGVPMTRARGALRAIVAEGHELGVHGFDHVAWHDAIDRCSYAEVVAALSHARANLAAAAGVVPHSAAAPGWHCTFATLHATDALGFAWASDTRGRAPFFPKLHGYRFRTPQLPTTLPTLDEVLRRGDSAAALVRRYRGWLGARPYHVMTAHAELEGGAFVGFLDEWIRAVRAEGREVLPLGALAGAVTAESAVHRGPLPGRAGLVSLQGGA